MCWLLKCRSASGKRGRFYGRMELGDMYTSGEKDHSESWRLKLWMQLKKGCSDLGYFQVSRLSSGDVGMLTTRFMECQGILDSRHMVMSIEHTHPGWTVLISRFLQ